jgi:hypothetical protein
VAAETDLIILDGCTFFYSSENGDVEAEDAEGLFKRPYSTVTVFARFRG